MEKIYVVTSGSYSDYAIDAIFTTEKKAEEYKDNFNCDDVEIHDLDPSTVAFHMTTVSMLKNGTTLDSYCMAHHKNLSGFVRYGGSRYPCTQVDTLFWNVNTKDKKRAIKVVNEKRIQILANECWSDIEKTKTLFEQH